MTRVVACVVRTLRLQVARHTVVNAPSVAGAGCDGAARMRTGREQARSRPEVAPWVRGSAPAPPLARHPEKNPMDDVHPPLDEMPPITAWLSDMDGVLVKENQIGRAHV